VETKPGLSEGAEGGNNEAVGTVRGTKADSSHLEQFFYKWTGVTSF